MTKSKVKINPFFKYLAFCMILITIIALGLFKFIDVLPNEYFIVLCILVGIVVLVLSLLVTSKKGSKRRSFGAILSIIYIIILVMAIIYELNTIGFLKKLGFKNYKTENYSVIVLNDSAYQEIGDIDNKSLGSLAFNSEGLEAAKDKLLKKIDVKITTYEDIGKLKNDFLDNNFESMLIEDTYLSILAEDDSEFAASYRVIYTFSIDVEVEDITSHVDITNSSFNIYVSGIDTYGSVSSVSRSDVNMVISVNPNTHDILITSIPRDYYVDLADKNGKDKLTHAGIYGIETSVKTIENLLDIDINYYVKVNFSSVVKLVDTLDGVDVYSKYKFTSIDGYSFKEGYNHVDGKKALAFVRERKAFYGGDRVRIENQAALVQALIDKAVSPSIITNYNSILQALEDLFITNLSSEDITKFIKMQIDKMPSWNVENISLDGTDAYEYTYSYGSSKLYVMMPDNETVVNAQEKIKEITSKKG